ncbi:MAG: hypothetical protein Q9159_007487, partial [Coniocarpon cinnabarinum]
MAKARKKRYFIFTTLITALIFWGSSTPSRSVSFTDSLFLCASAMTEAGLNTVNLSTLNTFQQFILFFLIIVGSAIFVSIFVVLVRLRSFDQQFNKSIKERRELRDRNRAGRSRSKSLLRRSTEQAREGPEIANQELKEKPVDNESELEEKKPEDQTPPSPMRPGEGTHEDQGESSGSDAQSRLHLRIDGTNAGRTPRSIKFQVSPASGRDFRGRAEASPDVISSTSPVGLGSRRDSISSRNAGNVPKPMKRPFLNFSGVGAAASSNLRTRSASRVSELRHRPTFEQSSKWTKPTDPFFESAAGFFSRNSAVHNLSMHERQQLGGCEYSAIMVLSIIVPVYFAAWQLLGAIACGAWVQSNRPDTARENGMNPFWVGSFNAISAFNNSGMSLLDANMTAFNNSYFLLLSMSLFILAGNTAYPIFLRMILWSIYKLLPDDASWKYDKDTLHFLLEHPRRCYTNLFPSKHTWWLAASLFMLNGIDWAMYEILNIGNKQITESLDTRYRVMDGLFQAFAVRSGGFYVVAISATRISLQVLYVIMMYISAYPVAITIRKSNVYEERSLGIYEEDLENSQDDEVGIQRSQTLPSMVQQNLLGRMRRLAKTAARAPVRQANTHFVRQQLRAQLSHDAWWICLAIFLITIVEGARFDSNPVVFSCFNVIFEVVSAYGCVGISVGVPWAAYSFCGAWHKLSKLILIAVMIRGRHRGLPVAIDHAVNLPGQKMWMAEEEDGKKKLEKSYTMREGQ